MILTNISPKERTDEFVEYLNDALRTVKEPLNLKMGAFEASKLETNKQKTKQRSLSLKCFKGFLCC